MKILALDISTKSTGWFITKRSCGTIKPPGDSFNDKLVYFREELLKLLKKYKPDLVVIEDAYYQPRRGSIHTLKALSKFAGVAIEVSRSESSEVEILTATMARKYCCGRSGEKVTKEDVFHFFVKEKGFDSICERLHHRPCQFKKDNDITDAAALALAYRIKEKYGNRSKDKSKTSSK